MRYFSFQEFDNEKGWVTTLSEEEIRKTYYPYWRERMNIIFGKEHVDENYCFEDCLDHWIVMHNAIESED